MMLKEEYHYEVRIVQGSIWQHHYGTGDAGRAPSRLLPMLRAGGCGGGGMKMKTKCKHQFIFEETEIVCINHQQFTDKGICTQINSANRKHEVVRHFSCCKCGVEKTTKSRKSWHIIEEKE